MIVRLSSLTQITQAYHSIFLQDQDVRLIGISHHRQGFEVSPALSCSRLAAEVVLMERIGNFALLPLRTKTRGPAYTLPALPRGESDLLVDPESESYDALDDIISLFRANTFFRNFEIKGPADRLLIYGILFLSECLGKIKPSMGKKDAEKVCEATVKPCTGGKLLKRDVLGTVEHCVGPILDTR